MDTAPTSDSAARAPEREAAHRIFDWLAVAVLTVAAAVALATFRDYGLGWDDYAHAEYGDLLVAFYGSGFSDQRALSFVNLYMYGGGFDLLAALAAKISPFTLFETRRLMGAAVGLVGLIATWRTGRRVGGPLAGLLALTLLACCPLYVGHSFMNAKDAPFAATMAVLLLGLVRAFEDYPRVSPPTGVLIALGLGLWIGSRVMGGFGVVYAVAALALVFAVQARVEGWHAAAARLWRFVLAMLPYLVLAYGVMALVWPWGAINALNPFRALIYFSRFFEEPWRELFGGELVLVPDMPRLYASTLLILQMPDVFGLLLFGGVIGTLAATMKGTIAANRRAMLLVVLFAAVLPVAVAVAVRPAMYNSIRHFVFVLPPRAVLAGLAGAWLLDFLAQRARTAAIAGALVVVAGCVTAVVDMVRLHPYQYTYFNRLAGGVAAARDRYMLDYWALSFKQASLGLKAKLIEMTLTKPPDRRWKLAVCGPHRSPQVELGPDFETTWDPQGADFAMMLGEFYCLAFDAPVLVEVARAGVVYARVYDVRGRAYKTLLVMPDP
jgi:hypothetical protein